MDWCEACDSRVLAFLLTEAVVWEAGPVKGRCLKNSTDRGWPTNARTGIDLGDDGTWHVMWNPEGSEGVNFTLVRFLDMNYGELDAFQREFNQCLKKRLDAPGSKPVRGVRNK
jgi:hypothetical protein